MTQINLVCNEENINDMDLLYNNILKVINPYEFIFSKVPGTKSCVSKLKSYSNLFYDLLEICTSLNIFENYNDTLYSLCISENYNDLFDCIETIRENKDNVNDYFNNLDLDLNLKTNNKLYDFIFFELDKKYSENLNIYFVNLMYIITTILNCQSNNGIFIVKIDLTFHKPVLDILYILSFMYEKTYVIKPHTSNIVSFEKYIVCKNFILNDSKKTIYNKINEAFINFFYRFNIVKLNNDVINNKINNDKNIVTIINTDLPYYFLNKIDEINTIIGQQQLESIDQIINIIKNKNKDDKMQFVKKINIQKSVSWCEKYKIPHNKFIDKTNIFMSLKNDEK
jgi:hypothetical protein